MKIILYISFIFAFAQCKSGFNITTLEPQLPVAKYGINEPSIAVSPKNNKEIAVGTVYNSFFYTKNAGKTWTESLLSSPFGVRGDPVLLFDTQNRLYYFHLADTIPSLDRIVCQSIDKLGDEFTQGSFTLPDGKFHDKPWVYIDPKTSFIHMTWTRFDVYNSENKKDSTHIMYAISEDRAVSWSKPIRLDKQGGSAVDSDVALEGALPVLDLEGNIHVIWMGPNGIRINHKWKNEFDWSGEESFLALPGGWDFEVNGFMRANGFGQFLCDRSGKLNNGKLYFSWIDQTSGTGKYDVWIISSNDNGKNWDIPRKVNQDKVKVNNINHDQIFSAMALDQRNGDVYIVYYDRRNYADMRRMDVILAKSIDGGITFTEEKVNKKAIKLDPDVFFGDYNSISIEGETLAIAYTTVKKGLKKGICVVEVAIKKLK